MRNSRLFSVEKQHDENGRRCSCDFFFYYQDIDDYICHAKDKSYDTLMHFGRKGLNVAATAAVMAATKVMQTPNICFVLTRGYSGKSMSVRYKAFCFVAIGIMKSAYYMKLWTFTFKVEDLIL